MNRIKKSHLYLIFALIIKLNINAQTQTENYAESTSYLVKTSNGTVNSNTMEALTNNDKIESLTYFDALGRLKQKIDIGFGGNNEDIVSHFEYDILGRQARDFLPYATLSNGGNIRTGAPIEIFDFYYSEKYDYTINPYSEKVFEAFQTDKVLKHSAPGNDWALGSGNEIQMEYSFNSRGEVLNFDVDLSPIINGTSIIYEPALILEPILDPSLVPVYPTGFLITVYDQEEEGVHQFYCQPDQYILDAAEEHGLDLPYSSRTGADSSSAGLLIYGCVDNSAQTYISDEFLEAGYFNCDVAYPLSDLVFISHVEEDIYEDEPPSTDGVDAIVCGISNFPNNPSLPNIPSTLSVVQDRYKTYIINQLYKTIVYNENYTSQNNNTTEEFKDKQGRVVLKRAYNNNINHDTYYVYDQNGNLAFVLPPKVSLDDGVDSNELAELCYQYKYDQKNRLIEKKIPGKGWELIVYNKLDQPILTQDAILQTQSKWLFTKYDDLGRIIYTGMYDSVKTRAQLQEDLNAETIFGEIKGTIVINNINTYYTNNSFPRTNISILYTINYYDDYSFDLDGITIPSMVEGTNVLNYNNLNPNKTRGLNTGSKIRILETDNWITNISAFDEKGRIIHGISKNDYLGTMDVVSNKLDFTGRPDYTISIHKKNNKLDTKIKDDFHYDNKGRLLIHTQEMNDSNIVEVITKNTFDELGQLIKKEVGGKPSQGSLQEINYTYNVRGWLKQINNPASLGTDLFSFRISYNDPVATSTLGSIPLYNGNISETQWKSANDNTLRTYGYEYDYLNRLVKSRFSDRSDYILSGNYNSSYNYDMNGNLVTIDREIKDVNDEDSDEMYINYFQGNKLMYLNYMKNGAIFASDDRILSYNLNGNLINEEFYYNGDDLLGNKNHEYHYNFLNLPDLIEIVSDVNSDHLGEELPSGNISYIYDANGVKLQKKVVEDGKSNTYTLYANGFVYSRLGDMGDDSLKFFNHPEGYVDAENGYEYVYQYKDHLGNVRLSYSDTNNNGTIEASSEVIEENNYYPFGLEHKGYNNVVNGSENNHFTYVGKERNKSLGYNMLEMDWRHYDPAIARFVSIDALAESYESLTPYHYSENSPIMYSDPTGLFTDVVNEDTGEVFNIDDGWDFRFTVSASDFAEISESGAIPNRLKGAWQKEFWKQVWQGVVKSDGSASDEITAFLITDDIDDAADAISNKKYAALLLIPLNKLKKLKKLKKWLKGNKGKKIPGTKKGDVTFKNREGNLPKTDANGKPVTYKEYDINPAPKAGQTRGAERMVQGSDGKTYYTSDHYKTFTEIKD